MGALSDDEILSGRFGGQRLDAFEFQLINADRSSPAALEVEEDSVPVVQLDTQGSSFRTVQGLTITNPPDLGDLRTKRIRPMMTLQNGSKFALGVFMFGLDARALSNTGTVWTPELFDETFLLERELDRSWSLPAGGSLLALFIALAGEVLDPLGIPTNYQVDDVASTTPLLYKVGTARIDALVAIAAALGALPPYFDNDGAHSLMPPPATSGDVRFRYEPGTTIVDPSIVINASGYKIPNRYIVVGDDVGGAPIRGVYDLPSTAPNSFAVTGERIPATIHTVSGLKDEATAIKIAYVDALTDRTTYKTATFTTLVDPRHGTFDPIQLLGERYLETSHSIECVNGGNHQHTASRVWEAA